MVINQRGAEMAVVVDGGKLTLSWHVGNECSVHFLRWERWRRTDLW